MMIFAAQQYLQAKAKYLEIHFPYGLDTIPGEFVHGYRK